MTSEQHAGHPGWTVCPNCQWHHNGQVFFGCPSCHVSTSTFEMKVVVDGKIQWRRIEGYERSASGLRSPVPVMYGSERLVRCTETDYIVRVG